MPSKPPFADDVMEWSVLGLGLEAAREPNDRHESDGVVGFGFGTGDASTLTVMEWSVLGLGLEGNRAKRPRPGVMEWSVLGLGLEGLGLGVDPLLEQGADAAKKLKIKNGGHA